MMNVNTYSRMHFIIETFIISTLTIFFGEIITFNVKLDSNNAKVRISPEQSYCVLLSGVRRTNARKIHSSFKLERYRKLNFIRLTRRGIQESRIEMRENSESLRHPYDSRNIFAWQSIAVITFGPCNSFLLSFHCDRCCLINNAVAKFFVLFFHGIKSTIFLASTLL